MSFSSDNATQINQLPLSIDFPREPEKFREILTELYKRIANAVNSKEGSLYSLQELGNFQLFFTPGNPQVNRNVYRKTFDVVSLNGGNIAGGATVVFPHNIVGIKKAALIYADCTSTDPIFFTTVYPNVFLDDKNINFTNPLASTELTDVYLVAEYLKN